MISPFLKKICLFFLPLLMLGLFFEIYLRNLDTLYTVKSNDLLSKADSVELLILGNSHACYGINPNQFDVYAYNLAQPNQSLYFDKRITLKYLDKLVRLKYVVISIDFHSLYFSSQGIRDQWSYYGYGIDYKNTMSIPSRLAYVIGYTPRVTFSFLKKSVHKRSSDPLWHPVDMEEDAQGFSSATKGWFFFDGTNYSSMNTLAYESRADSFNGTVINSTEREENMNDLDDFIHELKEKNITPIVITLPVYHEFANKLDSKFLEQNNKDISELTEKYHIQYWNFSDFSLEKDAFFNCDHLNRTGANLFSTELNLRLQYLRPDTSFHN